MTEKGEGKERDDTVVHSCKPLFQNMQEKDPPPRVSDGHGSHGVAGTSYFWVCGCGRWKGMSGGFLEGNENCCLESKGLRIGND